MTTTKTKKLSEKKIRELINKVNNFLTELKDNGIDFSGSFIFPEFDKSRKSNHMIITGINAKDNHHYLDCLYTQLKGWNNINHKQELLEENNV